MALKEVAAWPRLTKIENCEMWITVWIALSPDKNKSLAQRANFGFDKYASFVYFCTVL